MEVLRLHQILNSVNWYLGKIPVSLFLSLKSHCVDMNSAGVSGLQDGELVISHRRSTLKPDKGPPG